MLEIMKGIGLDCKMAIDLEIVWVIHWVLW
jgi:hypothetical protein